MILYALVKGQNLIFTQVIFHCVHRHDEDFQGLVNIQNVLVLLFKAAHLLQLISIFSSNEINTMNTAAVSHSLISIFNDSTMCYIMFLSE